MLVNFTITGASKACRNETNWLSAIGGTLKMVCKSTVTCPNVEIARRSSKSSGKTS
jgi:hypothetical protein